MPDLIDDLGRLAQANRYGFAFLLAYGMTWLVAGAVWQRRGARAGAYAVLFQGVVALPIAFVLLTLTAAGARPDNPLLDQLSVALATSQVFALPVVIWLIRAGRYRFSSLTLAVVTLVHFAPYSWLYQTPLYLVLAAALSVGVTFLSRRLDRLTIPDATGSHELADRRAWTIPVFVGSALTASSLIALLL